MVPTDPSTSTYIESQTANLGGRTIQVDSAGFGSFGAESCQSQHPQSTSDNQEVETAPPSARTSTSSTGQAEGHGDFWRGQLSSDPGPGSANTGSGSSPTRDTGDQRNSAKYFEDEPCEGMEVDKHGGVSPTMTFKGGAVSPSYKSKRAPNGAGAAPGAADAAAAASPRRMSGDRTAFAPPDFELPPSVAANGFAVSPRNQERRLSFPPLSSLDAMALPPLPRLPESSAIPPKKDAKGGEGKKKTAKTLGLGDSSHSRVPCSRRYSDKFASIGAEYCDSSDDDELAYVRPPPLPFGGDGEDWDVESGYGLNGVLRPGNYASNSNDTEPPSSSNRRTSFNDSMRSFKEPPSSSNRRTSFNDSMRLFQEPSQRNTRISGQSVRFMGEEGADKLEHEMCSDWEEVTRDPAKVRRYRTFKTQFLRSKELQLMSNVNKDLTFRSKEHSKSLGERSTAEYIVVLVAGMCLSFNAGYINGACLSGLLTDDGTKVPVSAFTGSYTKSAIFLAGGQVPEFGFLITLILCFIGGATLSSALNPRAKPYQLGPEYGPCFLVGSILLVIASVLSEIHDTSRGLFYCAAAANGLQNGMSSMYSGNLIRSTHYTGISTDIGIIIGRIIRGDYSELWKLWVLMGLTASFWTGGLISFWATAHFQTHSLLFSACFFFLIGMGIIGFLAFNYKISMWRAAFGTYNWHNAFDELSVHMSAMSSRHSIRSNIVNPDGTCASEEFLLSLFDKIDHNTDGYIEEDELYLALKEAGMRVSKRGIKAMMKVADTNGDGRIGRQEWDNLVKGKLEADHMREEQEKQEEERRAAAAANGEDAVVNRAKKRLKRSITVGW